MSALMFAEEIRHGLTLHRAMFSRAVKFISYRRHELLNVGGLYQVIIHLVADRLQGAFESGVSRHSQNSTHFGCVRLMALTTVNPSRGSQILRSDIRASICWELISRNAAATVAATVTSNPCC